MYIYVCVCARAHECDMYCGIRIYCNLVCWDTQLKKNNVIPMIQICPVCDDTINSSNHLQYSPMRFMTCDTVDGREILHHRWLKPKQNTLW